MRPGRRAAAATRELSIPTIGIGSGAACSGQVLVFHDLLGFLQHPHHAAVVPKFCKRYANVSETIQSALAEYVATSRARPFRPSNTRRIASRTRSSTHCARRSAVSGYLNAADECTQGRRVPCHRRATATTTPATSVCSTIVSPTESQHLSPPNC